MNNRYIQLSQYNKNERNNVILLHSSNGYMENNFQESNTTTHNKSIIANSFMENKRNKFGSSRLLFHSNSITNKYATQKIQNYTSNIPNGSNNNLEHAEHITRNLCEHFKHDFTNFIHHNMYPLNDTLKHTHHNNNKNNLKEKYHYGKENTKNITNSSNYNDESVNLSRILRKNISECVIIVCTNCIISVNTFKDKLFKIHTNLYLTPCSTIAIGRMNESRYFIPQVFTLHKHQINTIPNTIINNSLSISNYNIKKSPYKFKPSSTILSYNIDNITTVARRYFDRFFFNHSIYRIGDSICVFYKKRFILGKIIAMWCPSTFIGYEKGYQMVSINVYLYGDSVGKSIKKYAIGNFETFPTRRIIDIPINTIVKKVIITTFSYFNRLMTKRAQLLANNTYGSPYLKFLEMKHPLHHIVGKVEPEVFLCSRTECPKNSQMRFKREILKL